MLAEGLVKCACVDDPVARGASDHLPVLAEIFGMTGEPDAVRRRGGKTGYRGGDIPWDTGVVPPEVVSLVSSGLLTSGWALDLGCGSGLSSRYLASHGFQSSWR